MKRLLVLLLCFSAITGIYAQSAPNKALALSINAGSLTVGEVTLANDTVYIDFAQTDATRHARIDQIGALLFVPSGGQESVYTFSPYFDGFFAPNAQENRLRIREVRFSPDGNMLAFRIENDLTPEISDGVWFWQPARELATDPSYQLLRHCPPCSQVSAQSGDNWRTTGFAWASDNSAILIRLELRNEGRFALHVAYPIRDVDNKQAIAAPISLRYDFGHWSADSQKIVVSGKGTDGTVIFGTINRDGTNPVLDNAANIGMAWVQDAIEQPGTGQIVMLGSAQPNSPLQLVNDRGDILTPPIGNALPDRVEWSPDRTAVLLVMGANYYVAQVDGTITDITPLMNNIMAINWVQGALPTTAQRLNTPAPIVVGAPSTEAIPTASSAGFLMPQSSYRIGQVMRIANAGQVLYTEPVPDAKILTTLSPGTELILTAGPLTDGITLWWRVQTLEFSGWLTETRAGVPVFQPAE
jgi:RNA polymerase subunit RPABC4/transcription elongation factor Spt4